MLRLENVRILHVDKEAKRDAIASLSASLHAVTVCEGKIHRIKPFNPDAPHAPPPPDALDAEVIDCGGRVLMPGLIDSHVHVTASSANLRMPASMPPSLLYCRSVPILEAWSVHSLFPSHNHHHHHHHHHTS